MEELNMNKLDENELDAVDGGAGRRTNYTVTPIEPIWVIVTSSSLNCRYSPNGKIAKVYEQGHRLKVDGITGDGLWYRLLIYNPDGDGTCWGYIYKRETRKE